MDIGVFFLHGLTVLADKLPLISYIRLLVFLPTRRKESEPLSPSGRHAGNDNGGLSSPFLTVPSRHRDDTACITAGLR